MLSLVSRPLADTIPAVTVLSSPKGDPIAKTHSPTRTREESPTGNFGKLLASIFTKATSVRGSEPINLALNSRLSVRVT